jgi:hypothetical protein
MPEKARRMSLEDLNARAGAVKSASARHSEETGRLKAMLGTRYDIGPDAVAAHQKGRTLAAEAKALDVFVDHGSRLQKVIDGPVVLPEIPDELLDPVQADALDTAVIRPIMIPGLPDFDAALTRVDEGRPTQYDKLLPRAYMEGVAAGRLPMPVTEPYIALVDGTVSDKKNKLTTKFASVAGLPNLAHTPVVEVRDTLEARGTQALDAFGLNGDVLTVEPISVKEAAVVALLKNQRGEVVTRTREIGTDQHLVFDGSSSSVTTTNGRENGRPPRLTIVRNELIRPDQPRTGAQRGR